ncbi:hypothetical protein [Bradyrhizobium sp. BR 1432]|uniref:hypothetical protein n=1 Tax=Bradyrhizobium sp. BR 1432 TaxID=3447966 RepID=UPI003EE527EE
MQRILQNLVSNAIRYTGSAGEDQTDGPKRRCAGPGSDLLLSRHPARAVEFVPFDVPRPRTDRTMSEPGFVATKAHCLKLFQREVHRG